MLMSFSCLFRSSSTTLAHARLAAAAAAEAPAAGVVDARTGVDVKLEQQLGEALERHDKLRELLRGKDPDVERDFDVLR